MEKTLVSVIIPCYNHGHFLEKALQSVLAQTHPHFEIIVVDDGSTDQTKKICLEYPQVHYIYQKNSGLSAARNTGIKKATGQFLVFLDADDWLLEDALKINLTCLKANAEATFVSGGHILFHEPSDEQWEMRKEVKDNFYCKFLEGNFIGMHATVMYRKWIFDKFKFNTELKYCEDYDLYLKISRRFPIIHHSKLIAVYRLHDENMSANYPAMLKHSIKVLSLQQSALTTEEERKAYSTGLDNWKEYYTKKIHDHLISTLYERNAEIKKVDLKTLKKFNKPLFENFLFHRNYTRKEHGKQSRVLPGINRIKNLYQHFKTSGNKINMGDLNRTTPFSTQFGYDRGGPVDRYYIENFLSQNTALIRGNVLEIGDNFYTAKFGREKVEKSDILHMDNSNEQATYVGDLSNAPHLPSETFDCIILTQTLHLIYDFIGAVNTCNRILKKGGALLITVPGISHIAQDGWGEHWLWSFTDNSIRRVVEDHFTKENITVETYGNVMVATAFLYGMGLPEIDMHKLDVHDPHYQVIIGVKAIKS